MLENQNPNQPQEENTSPLSAEQPLKEENTPQYTQVPTPPVYRYNAGPKEQPFAQGGYTYQNPNPYQATYFVPPKPKKKNRGLLITAVCAAAIMLICCTAVVTAMLMDTEGFDLPTDEFLNPFESEEEAAPSNQNSADVDRDDETVYEMPEMTTEEKGSEELSLVDINKKVKNSVVAVLITEGEQEAKFSGSGFIISDDGYIITNTHVVDGASSIKIVLHDGITEYKATIVGADDRSDLAILKVDAENLTPVDLGDSSLLEVGETVVAIGNPYGMELAGTVTNGIISALNRKIEMNGSYMTLIQTNASINPGNSGGPLVNAYGQVIGITSSKLVATGYEGIGFAIPINDVVEIAEELITYGKVKTRAYIGISGRDFTAQEAAQYKMPRGVLVAAVDLHCDAAAKGLQKNDIIVGFNGEKIISMAELNEKKDKFHPGDQVTITYWRNNKETTIEITLTEASE